MHVGVSHIQLSAQYHRTLYSLGRIHVLEEAQVLLNGAVAEWAGYTGLCGCTLLLGNLLRGLLVNIGQTFLDEPYGKVPQLVKVVRSVVDVSPLETEPLDVAHDVLYVFCILLGGVGIVETQVANAAKLLCYTKVHADGLSVTNVDISVGFWWETGLQTTAILTCFQVFFHKLLNKAEALFFLALVQIFLFHIINNVYFACKGNAK